MQNIEGYTHEHPNATLAVYKAYEDNYVKWENRCNNRTHEDLLNYYKSLDNKCFLINVNDKLFIYAKLHYTDRDYFICEKNEKLNVLFENNIITSVDLNQNITCIKHEYFTIEGIISGSRKWIKEITEQHYKQIINQFKACTVLFADCFSAG